MTEQDDGQTLKGVGVCGVCCFCGATKAAQHFEQLTQGLAGYHDGLGMNRVELSAIDWSTVN